MTNNHSSQIVQDHNPAKYQKNTNGMKQKNSKKKSDESGILIKVQIDRSSIYLYNKIGNR